MTSNTNKENAISNGVKSIDRRRGGNATGNGKKGVRVSSSSTNIQKKLQLKGAWWEGWFFREWYIRFKAVFMLLYVALYCLVINNINFGLTLNIWRSP